MLLQAAFGDACSSGACSGAPLGGGIASGGRLLHQSCCCGGGPCGRFGTFTMHACPLCHVRNEPSLVGGAGSPSVVGGSLLEFSWSGTPVFFSQLTLLFAGGELLAAFRCRSIRPLSIIAHRSTHGRLGSAMIIGGGSDAERSGGSAKTHTAFRGRGPWAATGQGTSRTPSTNGSVSSKNKSAPHRGTYSIFKAFAAMLRKNKTYSIPLRNTTFEPKWLR